MGGLVMCTGSVIGVGHLDEPAQPGQALLNDPAVLAGRNVNYAWAGGRARSDWCGDICVSSGPWPLSPERDLPYNSGHIQMASRELNCSRSPHQQGCLMTVVSLG